MCGLHRSRDRGGGGPNGQVVSVKRAADGKKQRSRKIIDEERKVLGQELILAEHLDRLERNNFCDFDKPRKRAYQKGKIELNKQRREASRNEFVKKGGMPDRVENFREIYCSKGRPRARPGLVKLIRNRLRKIKNLIQSRPTRTETGLAERENEIRFQKEE